MTHSFPFEQFQCDMRLRRRSDHGCLAVKGKKADETPGTKEMRQGLWGAQAVTCIVLLLSFSPFLLVAISSLASPFLVSFLSLFPSLSNSLLVAHPFLDLVSPRSFSGIPYTYFSFLVFLGSFLSSVRDSVVFCRRLVAPQGYNSHWRFPCVLVSPRSMPNHPWAAVCY